MEALGALQRFRLLSQSKLTSPLMGWQVPKKRPATLQSWHAGPLDAAWWTQHQCHIYKKLTNLGAIMPTC